MNLGPHIQSQCLNDPTERYGQMRFSTSNDYILLPHGALRDSKPAMSTKHGLEELKSISKHTP